jgi:hypothetical protein
VTLPDAFTGRCEDSASVATVRQHDDAGVFCWECRRPVERLAVVCDGRANGGQVRQPIDQLRIALNPDQEVAVGNPAVATCDVGLMGGQHYRASISCWRAVLTMVDSGRHCSRARRSMAA